MDQCIRVLHLTDGLGILECAELRHTPMLQDPRVQELLIDGRQLIGELRVEVFDHLGVAQHGSLRCQGSGDLPIPDSALASETAVQSAPASSGSMRFWPRNRATKALTHWPHCARHPQAA